MNKKTNNIVENAKREIYEGVKNLDFSSKIKDLPPEDFKCCENCEHFRPFYILKETGFEDSNVGGCDYSMEMKPCKKFKMVDRKPKSNYSMKIVLKESVVILQILLDYFDYKNN